MSQAFRFRDRTHPIDWRRVSRIDIDAIERNGDIGALEEHCETVTFGALRAEDFDYFSDDHFAKLFRITQLLAEYLLHVQTQLAMQNEELVKRTADAERTSAEARGALEERKSEVHDLRREVRRLRRTGAAYELLLGTTAGSGEGLARRVAAEAKECHICHKLFTSSTYLAAHMQRRHADDGNNALPLRDAEVSPGDAHGSRSGDIERMQEHVAAAAEATAVRDEARELAALKARHQRDLEGLRAEGARLSEDRDKERRELERLLTQVREELDQVASASSRVREPRDQSSAGAPGKLPLGFGDLEDDSESPASSFIRQVATGGGRAQPSGGAISQAQPQEPTAPEGSAEGRIALLEERLRQVELARSACHSAAEDAHAVPERPPPESSQNRRPPADSGRVSESAPMGGDVRPSTQNPPAEERRHHEQGEDSGGALGPVLRETPPSARDGPSGPHPSPPAVTAVAVPDDGGVDDAVEAVVDEELEGQADRPAGRAHEALPAPTAPSVDAVQPAAHTPVSDTDATVQDEVQTQLRREALAPGVLGAPKPVAIAPQVVTAVRAQRRRAEQRDLSPRGLHAIEELSSEDERLGDSLESRAAESPAAEADTGSALPQPPSHVAEAAPAEAPAPSDAVEITQGEVEELPLGIAASALGLQLLAKPVLKSRFTHPPEDREVTCGEPRPAPLLTTPLSPLRSPDLQFASLHRPSWTCAIASSTNACKMSHPRRKPPAWGLATGALKNS